MVQLHEVQKPDKQQVEKSYQGIKVVEVALLKRKQELRSK